MLSCSAMRNATQIYVYYILCNRKYTLLPLTLLVDYLGRSAFQGVGLRPLTCWKCGFESRRGYRCLSVVSVVCCQVEVSATSRLIV